jgi:anti-sigma B factor antagonist
MNEISMIIPENFVTDEVNQFRKRLTNLINIGEKNFNIDFSKCNFIDTTGLGVLISIRKKCMKLNGSFKLFAVNNPNVMKVFEVTRLNIVFEIKDQI